MLRQKVTAAWLCSWLYDQHDKHEPPPHRFKPRQWQLSKGVELRVQNLSKRTVLPRISGRQTYVRFVSDI